MPAFVYIQQPELGGLIYVELHHVRMTVCRIISTWSVSSYVSICGLRCKKYAHIDVRVKVSGFNFRSPCMRSRYIYVCDLKLVVNTA